MPSLKGSWGTTIRIIVFSILLGGASGVLATALTTNYLSLYAIQLDELTIPLRLSEERPRFFPTSFEEAVNVTEDRVFPGLAQFFDSSIDYLDADNTFQQGAVLTADGWIITILPTEVGQLDTATVVIGQKRFTVDQVVLDPVTGTAFVKVQADNLPVLALEDGLDTTVGNQLFVVPKFRTLLTTSVMELDFGNELVRSADLSHRKIILQESSPTTPRGALVSNLAGELVGLVVENEQSEQLTVLPIGVAIPSFQSLLRQGHISHPSIGLNIVDLSHTLGFEPAAAIDLNHGALLFGQTALVPNSPAAKAGLQPGDIITAIDSIPIDNNRTIDELLLDYQPNDSILLTIDRSGEKLEMSVTLEEQS